jgi:hypothetical protein
MQSLLQLCFEMKFRWRISAKFDLVLRLGYLAGKSPSNLAPTLEIGHLAGKSPDKSPNYC